jgi:hypothetical protein
VDRVADTTAAAALNLARSLVHVLPIVHTALAVNPEPCPF